MSRKLNRKMLIPWITLLAATLGCDDRVTQVSREAANRQAQQNTAMAELNKEVATGTRQLVEADAQARKEIVGVHHELQAERQRLDTSWNDLEGERQHIAGQRRTESMLVTVATVLGGASLVVALLGFCWYSLVAVRHGDDADAQLNELLIGEFLTNETPLLATTQRTPSLLGHTGTDTEPVE